MQCAQRLETTGSPIHRQARDKNQKKLNQVKCVELCRLLAAGDRAGDRAGALRDAVAGVLCIVLLFQIFIKIFDLYHRYTQSRNMTSLL